MTTTHNSLWGGSEESGSLTPVDVYWVRLSSPDVVLHQKAVTIR